MTVQELIDALVTACDNRDPSTVPVHVAHYNHGDSWPDYSTPSVNSFGGVTMPFEVLVE